MRRTQDAPNAERIARVVRSLGREEIEPVLIGGMALVLLGSTRVTRDCDLVIPDSPETRRRSVRAMYAEEFALVSKWDEERFRPVRLIESERVAAARLVLDNPAAAFFWNPASTFRIDLVYRVSVPAAELSARAVRTRLPGGVVLKRASVEDLKRLKEASLKDDPGRISDKQDLVFLEHLLESGRRRG